MSSSPQGATSPRDEANSNILLSLLESVERDGAKSQRHLAAELGIALGLVNAYIKRCINKGLLKVQQAPAGRYGYYLTPRGFAEKSRLTVEYLSYSLTFFRQAKADCLALVQNARERGFTRIVLLGHSDVAEICAICALHDGIEIAGVVDAAAAGTKFFSTTVVGCIDDIAGAFDAVLITDLLDASGTAAAAIECFGTDHVLIPDVLRVRIPPEREAAE